MSSSTSQILPLIICNGKWLECWFLSCFPILYSVHSMTSFLQTALNIFFPRCYQSDRFDSTCMACCPPQRNKWKRNEINSGWATELRHPEFTDSCSQTPCGDWGEEDQWGKRGLGKGDRGSLPLGRKLWATDIALSQLPNPAWESHFQATCARVLGKNSLVPSADCKLKLAVGVKLTPSEWLQGSGGAGFCWLLTMPASKEMVSGARNV